MEDARFIMKMMNFYHVFFIIYFLHDLNTSEYGSFNNFAADIDSKC